MENYSWLTEAAALTDSDGDEGILQTAATLLTTPRATPATAPAAAGPRATGPGPRAAAADTTAETAADSAAGATVTGTLGMIRTGGIAAEGVSPPRQAEPHTADSPAPSASGSSIDALLRALPSPRLVSPRLVSPRLVPPRLVSPRRAPPQPPLPALSREAADPADGADALAFCPQCVGSPMVRRGRRRVCSLSPWCAVAYAAGSRASTLACITLELCGGGAAAALPGPRAALESAALRITVPCAHADWVLVALRACDPATRVCDGGGGSAAPVSVNREFLLPRAQQVYDAVSKRLTAELRRRAAEPALRGTLVLFRGLPPATRDALLGADAAPADIATESQLLGTPDDDATRLRRLAMRAPTLYRRLKPYQRAAVNFGLARGGRLLLGDDMGLGKTVQALALAACYENEWPLLVLAPASCRRMWASALERWLPFLSPGDIHLIYGASQRLTPAGPRPRVVVTSFAMARSLSAHPECSLAAMRFRVVIVDECHVLACTTGSSTAAGSQQTAVVLDLLRAASRALLLSGTPVMARPLDILHPVNALAPGLLGMPAAGNSKGAAGAAATTVTTATNTNTTAAPVVDVRHAFAAAYLQLRPRPRAGLPPSVVGLRHAEELALLLSTVMIRRLKEQVLDQLPPRSRIVVRLDGVRAAAFTDGPDRTLHRVGLAKVRACCAWLQDKLPGWATAGAKVVIFAHHIDVMSALEARLVQLADFASVDRYIKLDGNVPPAVRESRLSRFRNDPHVHVALISVTAGGQGIDLSNATIAVFAELPPVAGWLRQAEDRLHRQGQRSHVLIYYLLSGLAAEDARWSSFSRRLEESSALLDSKDTGNKHEGQAKIASEALEIARLESYGEASSLVFLGRPAPLEPLSDAVTAMENSTDLSHENNGDTEGAEEAAEETVGEPLLSDGDIGNSGASSSEDEAGEDRSACSPGHAESGLSRPLQRVPSVLEELEAGASQLEEKKAALLQSFALMVSPHTSRFHILARDGEAISGARGSFEALQLVRYCNTHRAHTREHMVGELPPLALLEPALLQWCHAVVQEWLKLSARQHAVLVGLLLQLPLAEQASEILASRAAARAAPVTSRIWTLALLVADAKVRPALLYREVHVRSRATAGTPVQQRLREHDGAPLCLICETPAPQTVLTVQDLFCGAECHETFVAKCTAPGLRRLVGARDAGVCETCGLDGQALLEQLRSLPAMGDRQKLVEAKAPSFLEQGAGVLQRLLTTPHMQYIWQCDHDLAVFRGGGACMQSNGRTLCLPCHRRETTAQAADRARVRRESAAARSSIAKASDRTPVWHDAGEDEDAWQTKGPRKRTRLAGTAKLYMSEGAVLCVTPVSPSTLPSQEAGGQGGPTARTPPTTTRTRRSQEDSWSPPLCLDIGRRPAARP